MSACLRLLVPARIIAPLRAQNREMK